MVIRLITSATSYDGFDDMMFSEPFNETNGYQSGKVWLYHGSPTGIHSAEPNWTRSGESANDMLGRMFASAGDVNEDGYDDVLLMYCTHLSGQSRTPSGFSYRVDCNLSC